MNFITARKRSLGKVIFSEASVILFAGGLPLGGVYIHGGVPKGGLPLGVRIQESLPGGGESASRGRSASRSIGQTPVESGKRAVRILLECFLV